MGGKDREKRLAKLEKKIKKLDARLARPETATKKAARSRGEELVDAPVEAETAAGAAILPRTETAVGAAIPAEAKIESDS